MSTSEITAWLLGVELAKGKATSCWGRIDPTVPLIECMTAEEHAAWVRLGEDQFSYWLFRGALEGGECRR